MAAGSQPWKTGLLALSALLWACLGRQAGTEVGNPEMVVVARFGIVQTWAMPSMINLPVRLQGVRYTAADGSEGMLWYRDSGWVVDMARPADSAAFPRQRLKEGDWLSADVILIPSPGDSLLPDTLSWGTFHDTHYVKWIQLLDGNPTGFLFALPPSMRLWVRFGKAGLAGWRSPGMMEVTVMFDCDRWLTWTPPADLYIRHAKDGMPYAILEPDENTAAYERFKSEFPRSFRADSVSIR